MVFNFRHPKFNLQFVVLCLIMHLAVNPNQRTAWNQLESCGDCEFLPFFTRTSSLNV